MKNAQLDYALPEWFCKKLGKPQKPYLLWTDSKRFILSKENLPDLFFNTEDEAFNAGFESPYGVKTDQSLLGSPSRIKQTEYSDEAIIAELEANFANLLSLHEKYSKDTYDFLNAFDFLDNHIIFWSRKHTDVSIFQQNWQTTECSKNFIIKPVKQGSTRQHEIAISLGEVALPCMTTRSYLEELLTTSSTYENAIIEAAATVDRVFHITGVRKDDLSVAEFEHEIYELQRKFRINSTYYEERNYKYR